ncbi:MAG: alpha/beta fold hydrolase [Nitrospirota bacterium]
MRAQINGITLAYDDRGTGLPLVFLHAFPFNRTMWEPQLKGLSDRFRVVTVDLRGHGESDAPLWHYTMDQFADDVKGLLDHLAVEQAVLAGLSMGGYLGFAFYRKYPERIKALVFADTRAEADKPETVAWRFNLAQRVYKEGAKAVADEMGPKLLSPKTYQTKPDLVALVRAISLSTPTSGALGDLMALAERPDSTPLLGRIACPTLVLVGQDDALTTVEENRRIAERIRGARFEVIPAAGHLSNLEQPETFNRAVRSFLETIAPPGMRLEARGSG